MNQEIINVGAAPNDGLGDPIRTAFQKTNTNFSTLFALPNPEPPATLVGKAGDVPGMYAYNADYFYYCFATYDGINTIWAKVPQINDISSSSISNGSSNVTVTANSVVTISVANVANVATFTTTGLSGTTTGLHNGLVDSFDIKALSWDFGYIAANTYTNPIQYLFAVTSAGNINMGTIVAPAPLYIDIGSINASTVN
jgi:hypothetical protein